MLELPHTVVGAAIAIKVGNPALALPLALASHFVLDLIPHWNPHLNKELKAHGKITNKSKIIIVLDVITSLFAGFYIASTALPNETRFLTILIGGFLGALPDVVEGPYFFFGWKHPYIQKLIQLQSSLQFNIPMIPGLATQVLILLATFWWIFG